MPPAATTASNDGPWRVVGEVGDGLVVLEGKGELAIVSLRRARATALRRDADAALGRGPLAGQRLLFPVVREVSRERAALAEELAGPARRLGFDLRRAGEHAIAVHAVPRAFASAAPDRLAELLDDHLERLDEVDALLDAIIARAVGASQSTDPALLDRLQHDDALVTACTVDRIALDRLEP